MGLFDRVERKLDRVINGAFARAFKAEVQPVEIAAAMRRAMDERAAVVGKGRTMVPNAFTIELDATDYERLTMYVESLVSELLASVEEHVESQRYSTNGPLHVDFAKMDDLDTGVFRVRPTSSAQVPQRRQGAQRGPSPSQRRYESQGPLHRPRNLPHPPEATAHADGPVAAAGQAATAATGAAAGTAAAGRAGSYMARHEALADRQARERGDDWDDDPAAREEQRRRDRAAWGDEESDADAAQFEVGAGGEAAQRRPMRIYAHDEHDAGWDDQWPDDQAAPGDPDHDGASRAGHENRQARGGGERRPADSDPHSDSRDELHDDRHAGHAEQHTDMTVRRGDAATQVHPSAPPQADPAHRPWVELDGDTYPLLSAITVLGRDSIADITLDDPGVSRRHAEIRVTHDGPHLVVGLRDLGSTNGTFVNGERIGSQRLTDGDRVTIGRVSFTVHTRRH